MITSQRTNGTTDPALFARGGLLNPVVKISESVLQHWAKQREDAEAQDEAAKAQMEFYNAVRPSAFILGFTQIDQPRIVVPRNITSAEEFRALVKEAEDKHENLFFHVGAGGTTATKDQILECPYLWGDCDPDRTKNGAQDWQEIEKELKGRLGIRPFGVWHSGSGNWQFLIKLDQPIKPDEAETLVDKLHTALGRNPVVRNCKGVLHVPGSVYWNNGHYYLLRAWFDDNVTTKIDDVRRILANSSLSPPKKPNGAAPVNSFPADEPTGLAGAFAAAEAPKASKVVPQVAGPVVPKDDHMGRSRIYRKEKRPNLCHYRDDFYDYEGGHYAMIDDHTIEANLYSFLDKCRKQVLKRSVVGGGGATGATGAAAKRKATAQATIIVPFEPDMKSIHETTNALKAVGHVLPTIEQPYWLDGRTGPDPAQLICFPNGILNLSTNEFMPPEPMLFTSHGVAFDYDPNAPEPIEWLKFLKQVFDGEQDQIDSLQEMFGYCVSSDVSQEKVFMLIGPKRSGKDTIRHTLQSLISPKAVCGPTLDSMGTNFGMSAFIGKQLAIIGDMRLGSKCDKDLLAENILKLSGRGLFTIDRKHKDHWTGPLPCKLLLISNEMPKIKDTSGALASRPVIFQTRISFYGREDPHLFRDKIRPELAGILNWSLKGLWRMHQRGSITEPACSIEAREELAREGSPIMAFVQECLTLDPGAVVNKNVMYLTYLDYADHNGLHRTSKSWFFRDLATATAGKIKDERVRKDGERVHNIVGAKISNPPPERPRNDHRIVVLQPAMPATLTAADVGEPTEIDVEIDAKIDAVLHATPQGEAGDDDPTNRA
jgi:P4 family phage/plasmid primase-like protien